MKSDSQRPPRLVTSPDIPLLTGSTSAAQQKSHGGTELQKALGGGGGGGGGAKQQGSSMQALQATQVRGLTQTSTWLSL